MALVRLGIVAPKSMVGCCYARSGLFSERIGPIDELCRTQCRQAGWRCVHRAGRRCRVERYGLCGKQAFSKKSLQRYAFRVATSRVERQGTSETPIYSQAISRCLGQEAFQNAAQGSSGTAKFGLQVAATVGLATVGSVVPVAVAARHRRRFLLREDRFRRRDCRGIQAERKAKGVYKLIRGTRGERRKQAAVYLTHCATHPLAWKPSAAIGACLVILGDEYDTVIGSHNIMRLAGLKSN